MGKGTKAIAGWAGDAERAIEWGERALRLSPFDPLSYLAYDSVSVGHFRRARYEEAVNAARKAIQINPGFSINYVLLAAPVVPEKSIRADSRDGAESAHHSMRCLRSFICLGRLSPTCLSRGGGLKLRTFFFGISSISH
jgi:tetratricopeptide (TPR) repeat protein